MTPQFNNGDKVAYITDAGEHPTHWLVWQQIGDQVLVYTPFNQLVVLPASRLELVEDGSVTR